MSTINQNKSNWSNYNQESPLQQQRPIKDQDQDQHQYQDLHQRPDKDLHKYLRKTSQPASTTTKIK